MSGFMRGARATAGDCERPWTVKDGTPAVAWALRVEPMQPPLLFGKVSLRSMLGGGSHFPDSDFAIMMDGGESEAIRM